MPKYFISSWTIRWIALMSIFQVSFTDGFSQNCSLESLYDNIVIIRDESTITLRLRVENARFNDLSDDFQGLCGVRLNFRHNNLSDLVMTLTSPIGNSVVLIGPADKNGTNPSPIVAVEHDISFVPSTAVAFPDPDLPIDWTNNNINWGMNAPYTGSYFPFNGDFAVEFKEGVVNGIWELTIEDSFINDEGLLRAFELEFCDDSDVACSACESRSGSFISEDITICSGESFDFRSQFITNNFDSSVYTDQFLIYNEDVLISYNEPIDFASLVSGMYSIYNLNLDNEFIDLVETELRGFSRQDMEAYVDAPGGFYCISRSLPLNLQINELGDSVLLDTLILCDGGFELFRGDTIRSTGVYSYTSALCDSILVLPVISSELSIDSFVDSLYLDCNLGGVSLLIEASSNHELSYTWSDQLGEVLGMDSVLFQSTGGQIYLTVDDGFCTRDLEFTVLDPVDTMVVQINSSISNLDCRNNTSLASISANFEIQSYTWWLSGMIVGTSESIILSQMGIYYADVVGMNGCLKQDSLIINDIRYLPEAQLLLDTIDCTDLEIDVEVESSQNLSYQWLDANSQLISDDSLLSLSSGGDYSVRLTNDVFCDTIIPFTILADTTSISIENLPSEVVLNCELLSIDFNPIFDGGALESVVWSNEFEPNLSSDLSLNVSIPSRYSLIATADSKCQDTAIIIVGIDTIAPAVELSGGTLTCSETEIIVSAATTSQDVLFAWSGPFDSQLSDTSIQVSVSSVYTVGVLDTLNECLTIDTILIQADGDIPIIDIVGDSILNCVNDELLVFNASQNLLNPKWVTPNGDSLLSDSIFVSIEGDYIFTALAQNGCLGSKVFSVTSDRDIEPLVIPDTIFLNCSISQVNLAPTIPSNVRQLEWISNNDTVRAGTFQVNSVGSFVADVLYFNGCTDQHFITVIEDLIPPEINIINDTIDCNNPVVTIANATISERYDYSWMGAFDGRGDTSFVQVSQPEIITLRVLDTVNGCIASQSVTVIEDTEVLTPVIFRSVALGCDIPVGRIDVSAAQDITVEWTDPDGTVFMSPQGIVDRAGPYSIRVIGENGCEFFTDWTVVDLREPVSVVIDTSYILNCITLEITAQPSQLENNSIVNWIYSNGDTIIASQQNVTFGSQLESVYIVDEDLCDTLIPLQFEVDTTAFIADILTPDSTNCNGEEVELLVSEPQGLYDISWFRDREFQSSGSPRTTAQNSGVYYTIITNPQNGCVSTDSVRIRLSDTPIDGVVIDLENEICRGDLNGSFVLREIMGGNGQISAIFDGQAVNIDQDVFNLSASSYLLTLEDEFGCQWDTILNIDSGIEYAIDLGNDINASRGEIVLISPTYTGSQPMMNEFLPGGQTNEVSFDSIFFAATEGGFLFVESTSVEGCLSIDSLFINFSNNLDDIRLYIPNVISPNGSGENGLIQIELSEDIISVDFFKIFDRWGQEIVTFTNILAGEVPPEWDGRFQGEFVEAGVYVYAYQITTAIDGVQKLISGDITVLR